MAAEQGFKIAGAFVTVDPDTEGFAEKLKAAVQEAVDGINAQVRIGADDTDLKAKVDEAKAKVDDLDGKTATARLGADDEDLKLKTDDAKEKLDRVDGKTATAKLEADDEDLKAKADDAKAKLDDLDGRTATVKLALDDSGFRAKLLADKAALDLVSGGSARGGGSSSLASDAASGGGGLLSSLGSFFGAGGGGLAAGPMGGTYGIGGIAAGVGALLPSLGGALTGLGGVAGAGGLAFSGVQQAMSAWMNLYNQKQSGAYQSQMAATNFGNTVQIQQAQQQIAQAHAQAAQVAVQSASQIAQSQMSLAMTERNAAQSDVQAQQSVIQAQQQLSTANFGLAQAQYSLSEAWIQARYALQQLRDQEANQATSLAAAQLAVQQAQYQQTLTDQNALSTSLDRQQAAIAVAQAQEQLTAVQQQGTYVQQQYNLQNKAGVSGSQQVVTAQEAVKQALFGVKDAQMAYADAQKNLVNTQLNNAEQVKAAQMAVTSAEENAAYSQQQAAIATQTAQRNLTNTLKAQQLQLAASGNAANAFAQAMHNLTGPQRQIVREFETFTGVLNKLQGIAGKAILPGVTVFFKGLHSFLPSVESAIGKFGGVLSGMLTTLGQALGSKWFQQGFSSLVSQGVTFMKLLAPMDGMFRDLFGLWVKGGPASAGLAKAITAISLGFGNLFKALEPAVKPAGEILAVLGQAIGALGKPLGQIVAGIMTGLAPALAGLLPGWTALANALGSSLGPVLAAMGPTLGMLAGSISKVVIALAPLLPALGQQLARILISMNPVVAQLGIAFAQMAPSLGKILISLLPILPNLANLVIAIMPLVTWLLKLGVTVTGAVIPVLTDMITWLDKVGSTTGTVGGVITGVWDLIGKGVLSLWHDAITPAFNGIKAGADWLYNNAIHPLWIGIQTVFGYIRTAASQLWHNVFDPLWSGIERGARGFVSAFTTIWNTLKNAFSGPVHFLVDVVYKQGIEALWNDVVGAIGLGSLKLPNITVPFAAGGIVPGKDGGRDTVLAALRPQEGVLVPEAVAGIGGPATVHALNAAYGTGKSSGPHHFGGGGIIGSIGSGISGAFHDVASFVGGAIDVGKMIAAIATGNTTAFVNAASKTIGTKAAGDLGKIMIGIPKTLVTDLAKQLVTSVASIAGSGGPGGKLPGGSSGAVGYLPANWKTIAGFLSTHGFTKYAAAGVAGNIFAESGGNPEILEIGGGGGGGLIQWTPYPGGYITGNYQQDLMTQLYAILHWGGGPGLVNRATSPSNAAMLYQDYYERPASLTASLPARMASANAVANAMGWGKFDNGGVLMPGTVGVNTTGQPEAVLTPAESQAIKALGQSLAQRGSGGGIGQPIVNNFVYNGTQQPTPEQQMWQLRDLALALGGP